MLKKMPFVIAIFFAITAIVLSNSSNAAAPPNTTANTIKPILGQAYKLNLAKLPPANTWTTVPGRIIVKYKKTGASTVDISAIPQSYIGAKNNNTIQSTNTNIKKLNTFSNKYNVSMVDKINKLNLATLSFDPAAQNVNSLLLKLRKDPAVQYAEPDYIYKLSYPSTNDANIKSTWNLNNSGRFYFTNYDVWAESLAGADMKIPEAWALTGNSEGQGMTIAVIDSGLAYNHPELANNMWNSSVCKDENNLLISGGCPNHGYSYYYDSTLTILKSDNNPAANKPLRLLDRFYTEEEIMTIKSHGTHVAGIIAGGKNNSIGVSGVAPKALIAGLQVDLANVNIINAINFAINNNIKIINASFGGRGYSQAQYDAIKAFGQAGGLLIAAAGNESTDNEFRPLYPCNHNLDNIICVAATDQFDELAFFSNYGATSVDVAAPGAQIYNTVIKNWSDNGQLAGYEYMNGTSMAAPNVAGVVALIWSHVPSLTPAQVKKVLLDSVDKLPNLKGVVVSGGRVNAYKALLAAESYAQPTCGDNKAEASEVCDGSDLNEKTCKDRNFGGGTLACSSDCQSFDTSGCFNATICTDSDGGKVYETKGYVEDNFGTKVFDKCNPDANYKDWLLESYCITDEYHQNGGNYFGVDSHKCTYGCADGACIQSYTCNNDGVAESGEDCDGADLKGQKCATLGLGFTGGILSCKACKFDTSACTNTQVEICGNNHTGTGEICDGTDLNNESCVTKGFGKGQLICAPDCKSFIIKNCEIDGCKDSDNLNYYNKGYTEDNFGNKVYDECTTNASNGWVSEQYCNNNGNYANGGYSAKSLFQCPNGCSNGACINISTEICGNNHIGTGETCDGTDLNNKSCSTQGFTGGSLSCTTDCKSFNTSACTSGMSSCTDSDNMNYYNKGYVEDSVGSRVYDYCNPDSNYADWVLEKYCITDELKLSIGTSYFKCPYGCSNGACKEAPPAPVCGNGITETGETCDDGSAYNGSLGYCNSTCTGRVSVTPDISTSPISCTTNLNRYTYLSGFGNETLASISQNSAKVASLVDQVVINKLQITSLFASETNRYSIPVTYNELIGNCKWMAHTDTGYCYIYSWAPYYNKVSAATDPLCNSEAEQKAIMVKAIMDGYCCSR